MSFVDTEIIGQVLVVKINRPERLNALSHQIRQELAEAWTMLKESHSLEVGIFTGEGRSFCAGEDMKESLVDGTPGGRPISTSDPLMDGTLGKPVISAVNGYAMGGGFMLVEATDLRIAVPQAIFEVSEAKRWLLGGYNHGHMANISHPVATEMALGFRFTAQRFYEIGFLNKIVEPESLISTALEMSDHILSLPPASRVNTFQIMREMRPTINKNLLDLATALHDHGDKDDLIESRKAFAEKRKPNFKGWKSPVDRNKPPQLQVN